LSGFIRRRGLRRKLATNEMSVDVDGAIAFIARVREL
jgi:hypothetical protein